MRAAEGGGRTSRRRRLLRLHDGECLYAHHCHYSHSHGERDDDDDDEY